MSGSGKSTLVIDTLLPRAAADAPPRQGAQPGDARPHRGAAARRQGDRHRPVAHRAHAALEPRDLHRRVHAHPRLCSRALPRRRCAATSPGATPSTSRAAAARPARATASCASRCTSCPTSTSRARSCKGRRYNRETLEVRYKGASIADVLDMTVTQARGFFEPCRRSAQKLETLRDVGPRLHPARAVGDHAVGRRGAAHQAVQGAGHGGPPAARSTSSTSRPRACTSPTSSSCSRCSNRLVEQGNTVIVIEHNLDVIKTADWVIDLGPEGGDGGGRVVATGTPEDIAARPHLLHRPVPARGPAGGEPAAEGRARRGRGARPGRPAPARRSAPVCRGASAGGLGGPAWAPRRRHAGNRGARRLCRGGTSAGGLGGPPWAPRRRHAGNRGARRLCRGGERGGPGGPALGPPAR